MSEDTFRNTITLTDAARMTGPSVFNNMIKPCGSVCNLDCRYCYYLDKASLYGGHEPKMYDELLEKVVYPRTAKSKPDYSARPAMTAPESDGDGIATWSVDSIAYGKFLCEIFRHVRFYIGRMVRRTSGILHFC